MALDRSKSVRKRTNKVEKKGSVATRSNWGDVQESHREMMSIVHRIMTLNLLRLLVFFSSIDDCATGSRQGLHRSRVPLERSPRVQTAPSGLRWPTFAAWLPTLFSCNSAHHCHCSATEPIKVDFHARMRCGTTLRYSNTSFGLAHSGHAPPWLCHQKTPIFRHCQVPIEWVVRYRTAYYILATYIHTHAHR